MKITHTIYKNIEHKQKRLINETVNQINSLNITNLYEIVGRLTTNRDINLTLGYSQFWLSDGEITLTYYECDDDNKTLSKQNLIYHDGLDLYQVAIFEIYL